MILVDNVKLYTGERSFPDGAVLVEGEKILYAGSRAACPKAEQARRIDGRGGILMPGFYNAHCHGAMTLMLSLIHIYIVRRGPGGAAHRLLRRGGLAEGKGHSL